MVISFGRDATYNYQDGLRREWLVANGLGGYASSTITGVNTRKYHGLLVAAFDNLARILLLSKLEEEVLLDGRVYQLSTNEYPNAVHPRGYRYQREFRLDPFPSFIYSVGGLMLKKTVFMPHRKNATIIRYILYNPFEKEATIRIFPLINSRDIHGETSRDAIDWTFDQRVKKGGVKFAATYDRSPILFLGSDAMEYKESELPEGGMWYKNMRYAVEEERGLPHVEDHYNPGYFTLESNTYREFAIVAAGGRGAAGILRGMRNKTAVEYEKAVNRREKLFHRFAKEREVEGEGVRYLCAAADSFMVENRGPGVIAGYPWFTIWGRDTMLALPGIALVTRRFEEARDILLRFAKACRGGLMPNILGRHPAYNSVDAPLLFFYAVYKYLTYTDDREFAGRIWKALCLITDSYIAGTEYGIKMDSDALIAAGSKDIPLTWMDARVDGHAVTPRRGKAVEVNALWYNALKILEGVSGIVGEEFTYGKLMRKSRRSFIRAFWNPELSCLYDTVEGDLKDPSLRPNQVFALSLPFPLVDKRKGGRILSKLWEELLTPYGLRSLAVGSNYIGRYAGGVKERDRAYHQGTVWSWLLGQFITALVWVKGPAEGTKLGKELLNPLLNSHLGDAGLGTISEIFDGDAPHHPGGCISQAWSVGEVLRCYVEDVLGSRPPYEEVYR